MIELKPFPGPYRGSTSHCATCIPLSLVREKPAPQHMAPRRSQRCRLARQLSLCAHYDTANLITFQLLGFGNVLQQSGERLMLKLTFNDLGIPFPLFEGPVSEAKDYKG